MMDPSYDQDIIVKNDVVHIKEFNKRALGRIIIKQCGNEGCIDNDEKKSMRRLLKEVIDYLPQQSHRVWTNATVTIYDINGNRLEITSGKGGYQFLVNHNEKGESTVYPKQSKCWTVPDKIIETLRQFWTPDTKKETTYSLSSSKSTVNPKQSSWVSSIPGNVIDYIHRWISSTSTKPKHVSFSVDDIETNTEDRSRNYSGADVVPYYYYAVYLLEHTSTTYCI